jgi:hypothetical protein
MSFIPDRAESEDKAAGEREEAAASERKQRPDMSGCRILIGGQLSDYNSLSGSNSLTNRILNKKINNLIYILI